MFAAGERMLVFTHFAEWGKRLADHLTEVTGIPIVLLPRRPRRVARAIAWSRSSRQARAPGALVLSLTAGGTGLNLTAANHVVLYDRWWNPANEDQARDRAWRIGQTRTVVSHRLVCPGTIDERVEDVVAGKRHDRGSRAAEVELARRPRRRSTPRRARPRHRHAAHRGGRMNRSTDATSGTARQGATSRATR